MSKDFNLGDMVTSTQRDGTIDERAKKVISSQLGVKLDDIKNDASIVDDLGADSLDTIELLMALEEEFEIEISDEEAERLDTVQKILDYLASHVKAGD